MLSKTVPFFYKSLYSDGIKCGPVLLSNSQSVTHTCSAVMLSQVTTGLSVLLKMNPE